ncbi:5'-nucleotidase, partial [Hysterangium stoloniferum]
THGVNIILGGHGHAYYASKGCTEWDGFDLDALPSLRSEQDDGVLVIKSGTDFRDLSEIKLELNKTSSAVVRKYVIKSLVGKKHAVTSDLPSSENMEKLLKSELDTVSSKLKSPLCKTIIPLDVRSDQIRTGESASANWFADILHHCYDDALCMKGAGGGAEGVFICAGALRGDSIYGPGVVTLGDILEILPFEDPIFILEMTGEVIWQALESSLKTWPAQEGRFPVISAFRIKWDSRRPPGQRVLEVSIQRNDTNPPEKIERDSSRTYRVVTREYLSQGHDGYDAFKGCKYLIDEENGTSMSTLVRKYLLGQ